MTIYEINEKIAFMGFSKKNIPYLFSKIGYALSPVILIYLLWCLTSFVLFHIGILVAGNEATARFLVPVSVAFFICLASIITMLFMVYVEKHIHDDIPVRLFWLFFSLFIWGICYFFVTTTGSKLNSLYSFSTVNLIFFSCVLGNWMTTPVKRPAEIIPLCVVVAFSDLFSVFAGPTKHLAKDIAVYYESGMQGKPPFVDYLLVKIAIPGIKTLMPVFGVSDWIIIAFLSAAACKFQMNDNITGKGLCDIRKKPNFLFFPIAAAGLIISIVIAQTSDIFIPALPFVVFIFLTYMLIRYPKMRRLTKAEIVPMALFSGGMLFLMAVLV